MSRVERPVVLLDAMDTLVHDPFRDVIAEVFGLDVQGWYAATDRSVYEAFEHGRIDAETWARTLRRDGARIPLADFVDAMRRFTAWLPGIPAVLDDLRAAGVELHVLSNYSELYAVIDETCDVSARVPWTFVSCRTGRRKPEVDTYLHAAAALDRPPEALVFVDDREGNCAGARAAGLTAVRFTGAEPLRDALTRLGLL